MAHPCTSCRTPLPEDAVFCPTCGVPTPARLSQEVGEDFAPRLKAALAERYRIGRELGRGGMAVVFLAEDLKHERQVAVKVLRPELAVALGGSRFLREIRIAAKLQHQHILALYGSGEAEGFLYYVMPFVEGESLRDKLNRERQLNIEEALRLVQEICDGLGYAHERGIVHRDIKPENILLARGHALIADFGVARAVSTAGGAALTTAGTSIGTPLYMSPEQAAADPHVDHRSDIYSLGCVLYEMLAGEPPFTGPSVQAIMAKHAIEARPSVRTVRDTVPETIDAAIRRAMAKMPADRIAAAAHFAAAVATPQHTSIAQQVPPSVGVATGGWRRVLWQVAVLVILVGATVIAVTYSPRTLPLESRRTGSGDAAWPAVTIQGTVVDGDGTPVPEVLITVDAADVQVHTTSTGEFLAEVLRVDSGDIVTLRATHSDFAPYSEVRMVSASSQVFDIVLSRR